MYCIILLDSKYLVSMKNKTFMRTRMKLSYVISDDDFILFGDDKMNVDDDSSD